MDAHSLDLTTFSDDELKSLSRHIEQECNRRRVIEEAPAQADNIATNYLEAVGLLAVSDGDGKPPVAVPEYKQPLGAHDAYPLGSFASQDGNVYRSLRSGNVWEPKSFPDLWELVTADEVPDPPDNSDVPEWEVGKAYIAGDLFKFKSKVYRVVQAHTSAAHWAPDTVPALYTEVK